MNRFAIDLQLRKNSRRFLATLAGAWLLAGSFASPTIAASGYRVVAVSGQHAPGTPDTVVFRGDNFGVPSLNEAGDTEFVSYLTGLGTTDTNDNGIWVESGGVLKLAIRGGDLAPGTPSAFTTYTPAFGVKLNDSGQIAFNSSLSPPGVSGVIVSSGLWLGAVGSIHLTIQTNTRAPTLPAGDTMTLYNNVLSFASLPMLNNAGHVAFTAQVVGSDINDSNNEGIWTDASGQLAPAIREHMQVPGMPSGVFFDGQLGNIVFNDADQIGFFGRIAGTGITNANRDGIWVSDGSGAVGAIARLGDHAPGTPSGVIFSTLNTSPDLNSAGAMAFSAAISGSGVTSTNNSGIWEGAAGQIHLVARGGDTAPGASNTFLGVSAPVINSEGHVVFSGSLSPPPGCTGRCSGGDGIWTDASGSVQLVALAGSHAPGTSDGVTFAGFDGNGSPGFNSADQVAFLARLTGTGVGLTNSSGLWATDLFGISHLIVRTGDLFEVAPGDLRTISSISFVGGSGNGDGRASGFNDRGQLAFSLFFTDGSHGAFVSSLVASVPEPASSLLIAIGSAGLAGGIRRGRRA